MKMRIAVVGLGIMGGTFARHLLAAGFTVAGADVSGVARERLAAMGAPTSANASDAVADTALCILSLPSVPALEDVAAALATSGRRGLIVMETSTLPIEAKIRARHALAAAGMVLLDCPVSGTGAQAATRDIVVMASGDEAAFRSALPVVEAIARRHVFVGAFGNASRLKLVANLLVTIHNVAAAEAFALGQKAGLDPATIYDVLTDSAGTSRMFQVRGPQMVSGRYDDATFTIANHLKDLGIIGDFSREVGASLPLFEAAARYYHAVAQQGGRDLDTASVCRIAEQAAGIMRD